MFSSPTGSPGRPDLDQTYPMSLSDDLREDALHDLLERIDIREGLVSPNPWSGRETELQRHCTQSFTNSLEAQTQPTSQVEEVLNKEFNVKAIMSVLTTPQVHHFRDTLNLEVTIPMMWMIQIVWYMHLSAFKI